MRESYNKIKIWFLILTCLYITVLNSQTYAFAYYTNTIYNYNDLNDIVGKIKLPITKTLHIEYPVRKNAHSESQNYFIMGTANPKDKLYMNGQEVKSRAKNGCFGVLVNLMPGKNTFYFTQTQIKKTVNLFYKTAVEPEEDELVNATDNVEEKRKKKQVFVQSECKNRTAWPKSDVLIRSKRITVSCLAPKEAEVNAIVMGQNIKLSWSDGLHFSTLDLSKEIGDEEIKSIGKIKYFITYAGKTDERISLGRVIYASLKIKQITAKVKRVHSSVFKELPINYDNVELKSVFKAGSEFVADISSYQDQTDFRNDAVKLIKPLKLKFGGYTNAENVTLLPIESRLGLFTELNFKIGNKTEKLVIESNRKSAFFHELNLEKSELSVTFENTNANIDISNDIFRKSKLVKILTISNNPSNTTSTFLFKLKNIDKFWGFNIEYTKNNNVVIYFKKKPEINLEENMPLKNLTIIINPGHGVEDPGTSDTPDIYKEKHIVLATSQVLKNRLESLGAKIFLTRDEDDEITGRYIGYDERYRKAEKVKPDFYISIHANSIETNIDLNLVSGVVVCYQYPQSKDFAENVGEKLARYNSKNLRQLEKAEFCDVLHTYSPAVLLELGFVTCPKEYERMCSRTGMFDTANAIADAIISHLAT